jgi:hypothetical protein
MLSTEGSLSPMMMWSALSEVGCVNKMNDAGQAYTFHVVELNGESVESWDIS